MATTWTSLIDSLHDRHQEFNKIWHDWIEPHWTGEAASTAHSHWSKIAEDIRKVADNYAYSGPTGGGMPGTLHDCANQINSTIGKIPIPLYENDTNPSLPGGQPDTLNGGALYQDYDHDRSAYDDGQFKQKALSAATSSGDIAHDDGLLSGTRTRQDGYHESTGQADRSRGVLTLDSHAYQKYKKLVEDWYSKNQKTANAAYESLLTTYAQAGQSLPSSMLTVYNPSSTASAPPNPTGTSHPDVTGGSSALPAVSGTGSPSVGKASLPDAGTYGGSGTTAVNGAGTAQSPATSELAGIDPGPTGAPSAIGLGSGDSGWGGGGGFGAGTAAGGSTGGVDGTVGSTEPSIGSTVGALPVGVGPRSPVPAVGAAAGTSAAGPGIWGTGGGAATGGDRDEAKSWLTEDQDVWGLRQGPDVVPPDGVI
jgi:hypothetical protein